MLLWTVLGALAGLLVGAATGIGLALLLSAPRSDGTFGFREIAVGLPLGALLGLVGGALLARWLAA